MKLAFEFVPDSNHIILLNNGTLNYGLICSYLAEVYSGDNTVDRLSFYDKRALAYADDDMPYYHGANGPRMRNWVGANQLNECNQINMDIDNPEKFVKPTGVDQLLFAYRDLYHGTNKSATIIIRDPAVDYNETVFVPDLISFTLHVEDNELNLVAIYENIVPEIFFHADLYMFNEIVSSFARFMDMQCGVVSVYGIETELFTVAIKTPHCDNEITLSPDLYYNQMSYISYINKHIVSALKSEIYGNYEIDVREVIEKFLKYVGTNTGIENKFHISEPYFQSMAYAMVCSSVLLHGNSDADEIVVELFALISGHKERHMIANEIVNNKNISFAHSFVEQLRSEYCG